MLTRTTCSCHKVVKIGVFVGLFAVLLANSSKTFVRNREWYSDVTLFRAAIRHNPHNGKVYNNLGHEMERAENYTFAEQLFRKAAKTQADDVGAYINLGRVLKHQGRYVEAEQVSLLAILLYFHFRYCNIASLSI